MPALRRPAEPITADALGPIPPDRRVILTIDGPAGTGKSTVAHALAARLGLELLDTGAMYRAATVVILDRGISPTDIPAVVEAVVAADIHFDWSCSPPSVLVGADSVMHRIRDPKVTEAVRIVSQIGELRQHMVRKQRLIGASHPRLVTEGRDQGSVVFPDADVKFYLDADPAVRASRRTDQLRALGHDAATDAILHEILRRDQSDTSRSVGPLTRPPDAVAVDTTNLSFDEVVGLLERETRARLPASA